ncbi:MAG TPA: fibronectin type III domain-containing protein [Motilibacterales bacterium]|nr:fibronectin type III domain-containing protein [Motilibacterales bacterium]
MSAAIALTGALVLAGMPATAGTAVAAPSTGPAAEADATSTAALSVTSSASDSAGITLVATSDARTIQVRYLDGDGQKRRLSESLEKGTAQVALPPASSSIRVRARATASMDASPWVAVSPAPDPLPSPGATYWVTPSSRILGKLAGYKSVNKHTRNYYLIRSYMERFEAAGGGTLVLGPGRYVISSTIYVPSNTTIRLSEGTTLVKGTRTGTKKFSASNSMFMLIRPSLGKKRGSVGGHDGAANITIAGAGSGGSVIDMANVRDALSIIAGHNRDVTISGITFQQMNNNHLIEMDGCADCEITGNEFLGAAAGSRDTAEAINLDTPDPKTRGFGSIWSNQDGTPNVRVTISSNRFVGMKRALGTHNFTAGEYHTDIVVTGNTIVGNDDDAIHIMNWANPVFTGNTISTAPGSVGIRACGTTNPTITGNTFAQSAAAVAFRSCTGENGTTRANEVTGENVDQMRVNLVGEGLDTAAVGVPGQGGVSFEEAQRPPSGVPSQPLVESVAAGDRQVLVRWTPALSDDRAPITAYRIRVFTNLDEDPVQTVDAPAGAVEAIVTGLDNGTEQHVTVAAVSSVGESPTGSWATSTATPQGPPSAPLTAVGDSSMIGTVGLGWQPSANDGGVPITAYRAHIYADADASQPLPGSPVELHPDTARHEWAGLTEGVTYYVRVTAVNSLGEGAPSDLIAVDALATPAPTPASVPPIL